MRRRGLGRANCRHCGVSRGRACRRGHRSCVRAHDGEGAGAVFVRASVRTSRRWPFWRKSNTTKDANGNVSTVTDAGTSWAGGRAANDELLCTVSILPWTRSTCGDAGSITTQVGFIINNETNSCSCPNSNLNQTRSVKTLKCWIIFLEIWFKS